MRKVTLFIAMSLDGYIADKNGGVDWLTGHGNEETYDSYSEFIKDIDTVVMGGKTYRQITTELSPEEWVYSDLKSYVITRGKNTSADNIIFTAENPQDLVNRLKAENGKGIWICGGAEIVRQLIRADLIDRYYISVIPTILGGGTRLFGETEKEIRLSLTETKSYNGITDLVYERR